MSLAIRDEILMCHPHCIKVMDRKLEAAVKNTLLLDSKVLFFVGDFRQVIALVPSGSRDQFVNT